MQYSTVFTGLHGGSRGTETLLKILRIFGTHLTSEGLGVVSVVYLREIQKNQTNPTVNSMTLCHNRVGLNNLAKEFCCKETV